MNPSCLPEKENEDYEAWLAEVELANEALSKLNSGEMTVEEFDYREKRKLEWQEREKQEKIRKEKEKSEKLLLGQPGKGEGQNYIIFCRHCFTEYQIKTEKCNRCGKKTISREERMAELKKKVNEYKEDKARKLDRKHKWNMWQKTKGLLWKKTSTNYTKWDYFTSSEEEENDENKDPILPKNDPNFQALERDLEQRAYKRKMDFQKADELKQKGNEYLKKGDFKQAINKYSEALDFARDYKAVYTNRALAYIKLGKYTRAIEDCNKVLEYCEVFEKGYEKSSDICFKALLRRALCLKEKREWDLALKDIEDAEKMIPNNKETVELKKEINYAKSHCEKSKQLMSEEKESKNKEKIDLFLQNLKPSGIQIDELCKILAKNELFKVYFFEKKGLEHAIKLIKDEKINCFLLLNIQLEENIYYQETFVNKLQGLDLLLNEFERLAKQALTENGKFFDILEDLLQLLINFSQTEKIREKMKENKFILSIYENFFLDFIQRYSQEHQFLASYFSFMGNLCYGASISLIKRKVTQNPSELFNEIRPIFSNKAKNLMPLKESLCNFIVNLCNEPKIREKLAINEDILQTLVEELESINIFKNNLFLGYLQALLGVFCNICFQANEKVLEILTKFALESKIQRFLKELNKNHELYKEIHLRSLNILSKLSYSNEMTFPYQFFKEFFFNGRYFDEKSKSFGYTNHVLRILARIFQFGSQNKNIFLELKTNYKPEKSLVNGIIQILKEDHEQRFCNGTIVAGEIVELFGGHEEWREIIETLIKIVRDKVNLMRKNAAIFLAKLSKNKENLDLIRELHGMEVLQSVSSLILNK